METQILTQSTCPTCEGQGQQTTAIWEQFFKADEDLNERTGRRRDEIELEIWFRIHGYYKIPPEEKTCDKCKGTGKIEQWVDVQDFIKSISKTT